MGGVWSNQQMVEARSKEIINACRDAKMAHRSDGNSTMPIIRVAYHTTMFIVRKVAPIF
jgi:hypothetical protein